MRFFINASRGRGSLNPQSTRLRKKADIRAGLIPVHGQKRQVRRIQRDWQTWRANLFAAPAEWQRLPVPQQRPSLKSLRRASQAGAPADGGPMA
jgi:hypothetical protein